VDLADHAVAIGGLRLETRDGESIAGSGVRARGIVGGIRVVEPIDRLERLGAHRLEHRAQAFRRDRRVLLDAALLCGRRERAREHRHRHGENDEDDQDLDHRHAAAPPGARQSASMMHCSRGSSPRNG
jgi:hypothetical protein